MSTCAYALRARALEEQQNKQAKKQFLQLLLILSIGILLNPLNTTLSPLLDNYQVFPPETWSGFLPVIEIGIFMLATLIYKTASTEQRQQK